MHIGADYGMGLLIGTGNATLNLRHGNTVRQHGEWLRRIVPRLHFHRRPIDCRAVEPWRRPGLEPPQGKSCPLKGLRKPYCWRLPDPARWNLLLAHMDQATQ